MVLCRSFRILLLIQKVINLYLMAVLLRYVSLLVFYFNTW